MTYNPATDFIGLWRTSGGTVLKEEMPGLDWVVSALGRSGLISVAVQGTAPVANQSITAWFQPSAPSYSGEGALKLWDAIGGAYAAATPALFMDLLSAASAAANTPTAISNLLNNIGTGQGAIPYRGATAWATIAAGVAQSVFMSNGPAANPSIVALGSVGGPLDKIGTAQGDILYRDSNGAGGWLALAPGTAGQVLISGGAGANPSWATRTSSSFTNSLGADVALNNTANYFDGPSVAQGNGAGTWLCEGTVTVLDTGGATYDVKLWDGTTVIASTRTNVAANQITPISLSGLITNPAGNIRMSVKDGSATTGLIKFNSSGNAKDSTVSAVRIA